MPKVESQVPVTSLDGPGLADWAEATFFVERRRGLSRSVMAGLLANSAFPDEEVDETDLEGTLDSLFGEVSHRANVAPRLYPFNDPFKESSSRLSRNGAVDQTPYEFLLWLSISDRYKADNRVSEVEEMFDNLVKKALLSYLGPGARALRFAHPSREGRPKEFPKAVEWLAGMLGVPENGLDPRPARKDGGVDVVAWRPFLDTRSAFLIILCQCTTKTKWASKRYDTDLSLWRDWIAFGTSPLKALAIPFAVPRSFDEQWEEVRRSVSIVLDRYRLSELLEPQHVEQLDEMRGWVESERSLFEITRPR